MDIFIGQYINVIMHPGFHLRDFNRPIYEVKAGLVPKDKMSDVVPFHNYSNCPKCTTPIVAMGCAGNVYLLVLSKAKS